MRRIALALVVAVLASACSGSEPSSEPEGASDGLSGVVEGTGGDAPGDGGAAGGPSGAGSSSSAGTATGGGAGSGTSGGTSVERAKRATATAETALNAYFDGLGAQDFALAFHVSTGAAQQMVRVRESASRHNAQNDGRTELAYAERSFSAVSTTATRVAYQGKAVLNSTVSGPAGDPYSESGSFENPVVTFANGEWRLAEFTYDGQPLVAYPAGTSDTVGRLEVRLSVVLAYGSSLATVVDLSAPEDHEVLVESPGIEWSNGSFGTAQVGALIAGSPATLFFIMERRTDGEPGFWSAEITTDPETDGQAEKWVRLKI